MERLVHIVPLGFETDRVVLPIERMHAHKVYLLCNPESSDQRQKHYYDKVRKRLEKQGIEVELVKVNANNDFKALIREVSRLIQQELGAGNRVHVGMSGSGRIAAAAATLAAMAHLASGGRGSIYYADPETYTDDKDRHEFGLSKGLKSDPFPLPIFELKLPDSEQRVLLEILLIAGKAVSYRDVILALKKEGVRGFEDALYEKNTPREVKNRFSVSLNQRFLNKLRQDHLIDVVRQGRSRSVRLTGDGEYIASLCSRPKALESGV